MPKLRNSSTDIGRFTQWLGRKCRNHHPLQELKLPQRERAATPNIYRSNTRGHLRIDKDSESTLVYEAGGRTFLIKVEEVTDTPEAVEALGEMLAVV
ncbi:MAG TPA: hypothetical protein VGD46_19505 [Rhizobacter sp.]